MTDDMRYNWQDDNENDMVDLSPLFDLIKALEHDDGTLRRKLIKALGFIETPTNINSDDGKWYRIYVLPVDESEAQS